MQGIAYLINGRPRIDWQTAAEILDAEGFPTGETQTTDNLQELLAGLPDGTAYELVDEAQAEAWWEANQPPAVLAERRREEIRAELAEMDRRSIRPLRAMAKGAATAEDVQKLSALEARAEELRAELAGLEE